MSHFGTAIAQPFLQRTFRRCYFPFQDISMHNNIGIIQNELLNFPKMVSQIPCSNRTPAYIHEGPILKPTLWGTSVRMVFPHILSTLVSDLLFLAISVHTLYQTYFLMVFVCIAPAPMEGDVWECQMASWKRECLLQEVKECCAIELLTCHRQKMCHRSFIKVYFNIWREKYQLHCHLK